MSDASGVAASPSSSTAAFVAGLRAASTTIFTLVVSGTYIGIGALVYDYGFSLPWVMLANMLIWAAPAQVLVVTALGSGAGAVEVALAVGLSAARFLPMVVSLIPLVRAIQSTGANTLEAITCALNERRVRPARGTRWYASSVANLLSRAQKFANAPCA